MGFPSADSGDEVPQADRSTLFKCQKEVVELGGHMTCALQVAVQHVISASGRLRGSWAAGPRKMRAVMLVLRAFQRRNVIFPTNRRMLWSCFCTALHYTILKCLCHVQIEEPLPTAAPLRKPSEMAQLGLRFYVKRAVERGVGQPEDAAEPQDQRGPVKEEPEQEACSP